jgi:pimeloyl-ACP methyl ester carboxylesterase
MISTIFSVRAVRARTIAGALCWCAILVCGPAVSYSAAADQVKPPAKSGAAPADKNADKNKAELPAPEDVSLPTADGIYLDATYYPSNAKNAKEAPPVVLFHAWKRDRTDFKALAPFLQEQGYAVLAPDFRGHGGSTRQKIDDEEVALDAAKFRPADFGRMVTLDFLAVRDFLWEKNNEKKLNLNKLCLVGEEMGAAVAMNAAAFDAQGYEHRNPYYGPVQLGRFVKALVLISPEYSFKGLNIEPARRQPYVTQNVSIMILAGKGDPKAMHDANQISTILEKFHPRMPKEKDLPKDEAGRIKLWQALTLRFVPLDTRLQGNKLLDAPDLDVKQWIESFLRYQIVKNDAARRWPWEERKLPHQ